MRNPFATLRIPFWPTRQQAQDCSPATAAVGHFPDAPSPFVAKTELARVREDLEKIDSRIADCLGDFRASVHFKTPDNQKFIPTLDQLKRVEFPQEIELLAEKHDTPRELFAGVALFLAIKTTKEGIHASRKMDHGADKLEEFKTLCTLLCERHNTSRRVYKYKRDNPDAPEVKRTEDGRVITFIAKQHDIVVSRMHQLSTCNYQADGDMSASIIDWVAAVNAGWQDMGINEQKGPFLNSVAKEGRFPIRYPEEWSLTA